MASVSITEPKYLIAYASTLRQRYHKLREEFHNDADRYFRQHSTSSYVSEASLIAKLRECYRLKTEYKQICDDLVDNGVAIVYLRQSFGRL